MRISDIDTSNVKVVIFDFDDTLAIHEDREFIKHHYESEEKRLTYYSTAYLNPENFYEDIEPCFRSEVLYNFINELRNKNIKMYCLSGMKFSFNLKAKQSFINKHYGSDIEIVSVASQQMKLEGIKIIQKIVDCNLDEILFVEDLEDTISYLTDNGVRTINVNDME